MIEPNEPILLSPVETIFWLVEAASVGLFRVTAVMRLEGCIEAQVLAIALQHLQIRHPKLRAAIVKGGDGRLRYQFSQQPPPIPFDIVDYDGGEAPWREAARRLMQGGFPAAGPLAAITVLRNRSSGCSEMLLTAHHAIADGVSAFMLMDDLLTEYARVEADRQAPPPAALTAVVVPRAKEPGGWLGRLRLLRRFLRVQRMERRSCQTILPEASGIPAQSQWVHWVVSREETLALVRRCRKEQVSLGAALLAAVFCGLMECLPIPEAVFKCAFPFDLRETLNGTAQPVTAQDLGCFASMMHEFYEVRQHPEFWLLARRAHQNHQTFMRLGGPAFNYNMAPARKSRLLLRTAPELVPPRARVTLLVTHYGVLNIRDAYGSLRPQGCTLLFKTGSVGPSLVMEGLFMGQRLNIGLAADSLDPVFWAQLQVAVRHRLTTAFG